MEKEILPGLSEKSHLFVLRPNWLSTPRLHHHSIDTLDNDPTQGPLTGTLIQHTFTPSGQGQTQKQAESDTDWAIAPQDSDLRSPLGLWDFLSIRSAGGGGRNWNTIWFLWREALHVITDQFFSPLTSSHVNFLLSPPHPTTSTGSCLSMRYSFASSSHLPAYPDVPRHLAPPTFPGVPWHLAPPTFPGMPWRLAPPTFPPTWKLRKTLLLFDRNRERTLSPVNGYRGCEDFHEVIVVQGRDDSFACVTIICPQKSPGCLVGLLIHTGTLG